MSLTISASLCDVGPPKASPQETLCHAEAEEDADFYYNEEEVRAGAHGEERGAMLESFDALLQEPQSTGMQDVSSPTAGRSVQECVQHRQSLTHRLLCGAEDGVISAWSFCCTLELT